MFILIEFRIKSQELSLIAIVLSYFQFLLSLCNLQHEVNANNLIVQVMGERHNPREGEMWMQILLLALSWPTSWLIPLSLWFSRTLLTAVAHDAVVLAPV